MLPRTSPLNLSLKSLFNLAPTITSRFNLIRKESLHTQIEEPDEDKTLVDFAFFKRKEMICTVSRHQHRVQAYTDKNSLLLGLWVYMVDRMVKNPSDAVWS